MTTPLAAPAVQSHFEHDSRLLQKRGGELVPKVPAPRDPWHYAHGPPLMGSSGTGLSALNGRRDVGMSVRVAINGFGRTGRALLRAALRVPGAVEVVAINDLGDPEALARLLSRDSVHGRFPVPVTLEHDKMIVGPMAVNMLMEPKPEELPWRELGIDVVFECTGRLTTRERAAAHIGAGATRVIISAPGQRMSTPLS